MRRKWPTVPVINPNPDTPCFALLLLAGSISINTNLLSLRHTNTLGKLLLARENSVSAQLRTRPRPSEGDLTYSPSRQWAFNRFLLQITSQQPMGRLFKQGARSVPCLSWLPRKPDPSFPAPVVLQDPILGTSTLLFSVWKRLTGRLHRDANT